MYPVFHPQRKLNATTVPKKIEFIRTSITVHRSLHHTHKHQTESISSITPIFTLREHCLVLDRDSSVTKEHVELLLRGLSNLRRCIIIYAEEADGGLTLSSDESLA